MRQSFRFGVFCLLFVLVVGALAWRIVSAPSGIILTCTRFEEIDDHIAAVVVLENRSSKSASFLGAKGSPQTHFTVYDPDKLLMGYGPYIPYPLAAPTQSLQPGQRIEFLVLLHLGAHSQRFNAPFKVGIKIPTEQRQAVQAFCAKLGVARKFWPNAEVLIWSEMIYPPVPVPSN